MEGRQEGSVEKKHEANWIGAFEGRDYLLFNFVFLNLCRAWYSGSTLYRFVDLSDIFVTPQLGLMY